jgi:hypothetical protein
VPNIHRSRVLALAVAAAALTGCSGGSSQPQPSPTPTTSAAEQLTSLARAGVASYYTAVYTLKSTSTSSAATVTIRRSTSAYRVDIETRGSDAILLRNQLGTYSCEAKVKKKATCFYVAKAGKPIPATFDAGVQKVFGTYLLAFAQSAQLYDVTIVDPRPPMGALPEGRCFLVVPTKSSPKPVVPAGTYCFSNNGLPVHVAFPSGTLDITSLAIETPAPHLLLPPVEATPIPGVR